MEVVHYDDHEPRPFEDLSNYKTCTFSAKSVNLASKLILTVVAGLYQDTGGVAANSQK
jgi:hypothetical protein